MKNGMANKEKIDYLLLDLKELETLIAGMRDAEVYPVSFFSQTFNLTHKVLNDLHSLEAAQIEMLRKQMEAHQALIQSLPTTTPIPVPVAAEPEIVPVEEKPAEPQPVIQPEPVVKTEPIIQPEPVAVEQEQAAPVRQEPIQPEPVHQEPVRQEPIRQDPVPAKEPQKQPEVSHKTSTNEKQGLFLNDLLEKKNLSDFRKAFSLNDRFRFRRELFGGDESKMNKAIADLNEIHSYEESVTYLNNELKWNIEDEAVADFIKLLEKRFL